MTLRAELQRQLGLRLLDGDDLRGYGPQGLVRYRCTSGQFGSVLDWWEEHPLPGGLEPRLTRLGQLRAALGGTFGDFSRPTPQEREILVGLERVQHWSAGEPHAKRAGDACQRAWRVFHAIYCGTPLAGLSARASGYAGIGRLERLGLALARASTEVAKLG